VLREIETKLIQAARPSEIRETFYDLGLRLVPDTPSITAE
jgi:hypothetical protein